jgi:uncharacterized membrane protein
MRKWYPWLLVGTALGLSAVMFPRLPDRVPSHWDAAGNVNGYTSRAWAVSMMPAIMVALALILPRLPAIDPRRANYEKFRPTYDLVVNLVLALNLFIHAAVLGAGAGLRISMDKITPLAVGVVFLVLGNVLPRARSNWLFGIRTPWTLSSDRVWERTHRLGGVLFVIAGFLLIAAVFVPPRAAFVMMVATGGGAAIIPIVYSYFVWRQEARRVQSS